MKKFMGFMLLIFLSTQIYALNLDDVIRLSEANVGDDIILSVIAVSKDEIKISTNDIIRLKNKGVSSEVITALIKKSGAKKQEKRSKEEREEIKVEVEKRHETADKRFYQEQEPRFRYNDGRDLSPFDQFFLSTYYSHDYGWPEKNYRSSEDILSQGLYYQPPQFYPNARDVRLYGFGFSNSRGTPFGFNFSPFSIKVNRNQLHNGYNYPGYGYYGYNHGSYGKRKRNHKK